MDDVGETIPDDGGETGVVLTAFEIEDELVDTAIEEEEGGDEEVLDILLLELIDELRLVLDDEVVATNDEVFELLTLVPFLCVVTWEADFVALLELSVAFPVALEVALVDLERPAADFGFGLLLPKIALRASKDSEASSSIIDSSARDRQMHSPNKATRRRVRRILM